MQPHSHSHNHAHPHGDKDSGASSVMRIQRLAMFLEAHFGEVELHMPEEDAQELEQGEDEQHDPSLIVRLDEADARINLLSLVCSISLICLFVLFPCLICYPVISDDL